MVRVAIGQGRLVVEVEGLDRLLAMRHRVDVPLEHVVWVQTRPDEAYNGPTGTRLPGTHLPGVISPGIYRGTDGDVFWDVHDPGKSIAIRLRDEPLVGLVVEVDDPDKVERAIVRALRGEPL
ncbi:MAG: hypothetical protein ACP5VP_05465 [Candidatus Limnocylindrales bacterium]